MDDATTTPVTFEDRIFGALGGSFLREDPLVRTYFAQALVDLEPEPLDASWNPVNGSTVTHYYCLALPPFVSGNYGQTCSILEKVLFAPSTPNQQSLLFEGWRRAASKAYYLYWFAISYRSELAPGEQMGTLLDVHPSWLTGKAACDDFFQANPLSAFPITQRDALMQTAALRTLYTGMYMRLPKVWSDREGGSSTEGDSEPAIFVGTSLENAAQWYENIASTRRQLAMTVELASVHTILYTQGKSEAWAKLAKLRDREVEPQEGLRWLILVGDAFCTQYGPPETLGFFVFLTVGEYVNLDKFKPTHSDVLIEKALEFYKAAWTFLAGIDAVTHVDYARFRGQLLLRQAYLTFMTHSAASPPDWEAYNALMVLTDEAIVEFVHGGDALGEMIATAHSVIYQVGGTGDWKAGMESVRYIGEWARDRGSFSYGQGIGHLFITVARHWHTEFGDFRRAFALYRLAEFLFNEMDAIMVLSEVRMTCLRYVMDHSKLEITRVLSVPSHSLQPSQRYPLVTVTLRAIKTAIQRETGSHARLATSWLKFTLTLLAIHANNEDDVRLWRFTRSEAEGTSALNLLVLWAYVPQSPTQCFPEQVISFFKNAEVIKLHICLSEFRTARKWGDRKEMRRATEAAEKTISDLVQPGTTELIQAMLKSKLYLVIGSMESALVEETRHCRLLRRYQFERLREALRCEAEDPSHPKPSPATSTSSTDCRIAYFATLLESFYTAVRHGWTILAREQYNLIMDLRDRPELAPKYWSLRDQIWRWYGMTAILLAAENDVRAAWRFQAFLKELERIRQTSPNGRQIVALLATSDCHLIHEKLAEYVMRSCSKTVKNGLTMALHWTQEDRERISMALSIIEFYKAQALTTTLEPPSPSGEGDDFANAFQGNVRSLRIFNNFRRAQKTLEPGSQSEEMLFKTFIKQVEHSQGWDMLVDRLESPTTFTGALAPKALAALVERIPSATVILDYFYTESQIMVWAVDRNGVQALYRTSSSTSHFEGLIERLKHDMEVLTRYEEENPGKAMGTRRSIASGIETLSNLLIEPLRRFLSEADNRRTYDSIMVVPHGVLHQLPFHLLTSGKVPLGRAKKMSQIPSLNLLPHIHDHLRPLNPSLLATLGVKESVTFGMFGYEDPPETNAAFGVDEEIDLVSRLSPPRYDAVPPKTVQKLRECLEDTDFTHVFHCAAHGQHDPVSGLFSRIQLPSKQFWTVQDSLKLQRAPVMVFWSACESVIGKATAGVHDGECFGSAFLVAGSCYVFGTLWKVDGEDCKVFTQAFYEALTGDAAGDPAKALLMARIKLSDVPRLVPGQAMRLPSPARWGAFVLIGTTACPPKVAGN